MLYLLNAVPGPALIGRRGTFRAVSRETALETIMAGGWTSAIGHAETAQALSAWAGVEIQFSRVTLTLEKGDRLLVAALRGPRLPEGAVLSREEVESRGFDFLELEIEVSGGE